MTERGELENIAGQTADGHSDKELATAFRRLVKILEPLTPEERERLIRSLWEMYR